MRLVRPTHPPSMAVLVDTVLHGIMELAIPQADNRFNRLDAICVDSGEIKLFTGVPAYHPMRPNVGKRRLIATIYVPHSVFQIMHHHITETI